MADNMPAELRAGRAVGAMLGAAFGDALGWPNERIAKSKAPKQQQGRLQEFRQWTRRSGGRFFQHEEIIEAGEYSDGELIEDLIRNVKTWSTFPDRSILPADWWNQADKVLKDYSKVWEATKLEILEYLKVCQTEIAKGALSIDDEALRRLQVL